LHFFSGKKVWNESSKTQWREIQNQPHRKKIGKKKDRKKAQVYFQTIYVIHSASVCASTCLKKTDRQTRNSDLFDLVFNSTKKFKIVFPPFSSSHF